MKKRLLSAIVFVSILSCSTKKAEVPREPASAKLPYLGLADVADLDTWTVGFFQETSKAPLPDLKELTEEILAAYENAKDNADLFNQLNAVQELSWRARSADDYSKLAAALFESRIRVQSEESQKARAAVVLFNFLAEETLTAGFANHTVEFKALLSDGHLWRQVLKPGIDPDCTDGKSARVDELMGLPICQGDILASKGKAGSSSFLARMADVPGNYSHSTIAYVGPPGRAKEKPARHGLSLIESFIEDGTKLRRPNADYIDDYKRRLFVYRYNGAARETVVPKIIRAVDDFEKVFESRTKGNPFKHAGFRYDYDMDAVTSNRNKSYFCSEIVYAIYKDWAKAFDKVNPYNPDNWSSISGVTQAFFHDYMSISQNKFPAPGDVERNPQYQLIGYYLDVPSLRDDRIDVALIDSLLSLAQEKEPSVRKALQILKKLGNTKISTSFIDKMTKQGSHLLPKSAEPLKQMLKERAGSLPENINIKQLLFFSYLDMKLAPEVRTQIRREEDALFAREKRLWGPIELRARVSAVMLDQIKSFIDQNS